MEKFGPTDKALRLMRMADGDLRSALLSAERRAGRTYCPLWTLQLQKAYAVDKFWKVYTRNFGQLQGYISILSSLSAKAGWPSCPDIDLANACIESKKAKEKL